MKLEGISERLEMFEGFSFRWKTWKLVKEVSKSVWGMPRLSEAKKDVISCEKLRGSANRT